MFHLTLDITGMSCGHCVSRVQKTLAALDGVAVKGVSIGAAAVDLDPARQTVAAVLAALDEAGYPAVVRAQA
jgi:copper chaperone CopZ